MHTARRNISQALLVLGLFLLSTRSVSAAGRVIYDGFESTTINAPWIHGDYGGCVPVISAIDGGVGPKAGSRMAKCNWNGQIAWDQPGSQLQEVLNMDGYFNKEFLIRFWARFDADKDTAPGAKLFRFGNFNPTGGGDMAAYQMGVADDDGTAVLSFYGTSGQLGATCWVGNPFASSRTTWHKVEIYSYVAAAGRGKIWVDDNLLCDRSGNTVQEFSPYQFTILSNWSSNPGWEHDANNHTYWDEFEIYSDTGTSGSGLMSDGAMTQGGGDTTAPAAPTGLGVN